MQEVAKGRYYSVNVILLKKGKLPVCYRATLSLDFDSNEKHVGWVHIGVYPKPPLRTKIYKRRGHMLLAENNTLIYLAEVPLGGW